ncbi:MAG TPA: hypothetical protein VIT65_10180 [Microlunatus sp.]
MTDSLDKTEIRTLVAAVRARIKAAKADLDRQCDLQLAKFEADLSERFDPVDRMVEKLYLAAADTMIVANTEAASALVASGYPAGWAPRLTVERMPKQATTATLRARLRTQAKATVAAMRRDGTARLNRAEADLLIDLTSGLMGNPGLDRLATLPSVEELAPALLPDLELAVKQLTAGEG